MAKTNDHNPELRDVSHQPCIGLLELCSVARGVEVANAILWEAEVEMLFATPVQPGKFVMLFTGSVEDVRSSIEHGAGIGGSDVVDRAFIPQIHPGVATALRRGDRTLESGSLGALGVVETTTVAASIIAADLALKAATVELVDLRIANGLGGKSYFSLSGDVADVRSSVASGSASAEERGLLARQVVIPNPHPDLEPHL